VAKSADSAENKLKDFVTLMRKTYNIYAVALYGSYADTNQFRILYFLQMLDQIVLVHGFSKKTQQLKKQDIDLAEKRMEDWMRRFPTGGET
jgi:phage-related protein